jgi:glycine betaine transporter
MSESKIKTFKGPKELTSIKSVISKTGLSQVDWLTFTLSGGFLIVFVIISLVSIETLSKYVDIGFVWSSQYFGAYWQVLLLATFIIGLIMALSPYGSARLGGTDKPEIGAFKWLSMIMCTLLAGGGVFFAAAEPIAHYISMPPIFEADANPVHVALAQSFLHWGFLAWAILGSLTTTVLMYLHYDKGLPLRPRTLLYPLFGEKVIHGWIGSVVDACCVISVVAGTIGPIGFTGLQVGYGFSELLGTANDYRMHFVIILGLVGIATISAITGINRGIQLLSKLNILIALSLMVFIFCFGPTSFIVENYFQASIIHLKEFIPMAVFRDDTQWLSTWTVFFWGWFLGYGPLMAMFISKISKGRTIREIVICVSVFAPIVTTFWFTIVGGSGMFFELTNPGSIADSFSGFNMPAALLAMTQQLPMGIIISVLFLILTTLFVITTTDSMTYTISMVMVGNDNPPTILRVFWCVMMGVVALILVSIGSGGIAALQSFIVITAVPVSLILLPSLWNAPMIAKQLAKQQGLLLKSKNVNAGNKSL